MCLKQDYHARLVHLQTTAFLAAACVQLHTRAALSCTQTHALEVAPPPHHFSTRVIDHSTFLLPPATLRVQNASQKYTCDQCPILERRHDKSNWFWNTKTRSFKHFTYNNNNNHDVNYVYTPIITYTYLAG